MDLFTVDNSDKGTKNAVTLNQSNVFVREANTFGTVNVANTKVTSLSTSTVQEFNDDGSPEKQKLTDAIKAVNISRIVSGQTITAPPVNRGGGSVIINKDTTALKHKNVLHENGAYGDPELLNSTEAFRVAATSAASMVPAGLSLKRRQPNTRERNKIDNYYLTNDEKSLLARKATEFASVGIVPYDALEEFLYVLVNINVYDDMKYVSAVTGVAELDDSTILREPYRILNLPTLYKISYLANGVTAITKQFSTSFPSARGTSDSKNSAYGSLLSVANFASSPLGALAAVYGVDLAVQSLGLTGNDATVAASQLTSQGTIEQFPGVAVVIEQIATNVTRANNLTDITDQFGTPAGFGGTSGQIAQLPNAITILTFMQSNLNTTIETIDNQNIYTMFPLKDSIKSIVKQVKNVINYCNQLTPITTIPSSADKKADIVNQLQKINDESASIETNITSLYSEAAAISGPGNISSAAGPMIGRVGGNATSSLMSRLVLGQGLPPSVLCRNPMMQPPSYAGRAFFGEGVTPRIAMDQVFSKRIATYPTNPAGAGLMSFQMQNYSSYGGTLSLSSLVSRVMFGTSSAPTTGPLSTLFTSKLGTIASLLGVSAASNIEPRRSDNAIPFMIATSAGLINDTKCPFSTSVFSSGWRNACSVGNDVQRYNPQFLETARTLL